MRFLKLTAAGVMFCALALGETWSGTLVDIMCKGKDLATHSRECALMCSRSGYGLVLPDGKFLKFDEAGNSKAVSALKASKKDTDLKAKITGQLDGDVIRVQSVEIQ